MVADQNHYKRFFVAVEGFTDKVGSADYNAALSRRRADAVVEYLVAQHDIPIYRIHMVGLGEQKPVEDARNRAANAKNRRVEVTLFSADQSLALNSGAQPATGGSGPAINSNLLGCRERASRPLSRFDRANSSLPPKTRRRLTAV